MKKVNCSLILMSILLILVYGCGGGSSGGSKSSNNDAAANNAPIANAGSDQIAQVDDEVTLDGGGSSDKDGDYPLTYKWQIISIPEESQAAPPEIISSVGFDGSQLSITADFPGVYEIQLVVTDSKGLKSKPDLVVVDVNAPPIAEAGPDQTSRIGEQVTLDGAGSYDEDGDILIYSWTLTVPHGSTASLSDPAAVNPTFVVDISGTYVAQLIVNDGMVDSSPDTVTINMENSPPVADAGPDQTAKAGDLVTLWGGASSDVDGDSLSFFWMFITVPDGSSAFLSDPEAVNPSFVVDVSGTYVAELIVNDGMVDSSPDTVTINMGNSPPVADAGPDQTFTSAGKTIQLDGSQSYDSDGDRLTYAWHIISKPPTSSTTLSDDAAVYPTFIADSLGTYIVQLIVTDDWGASSEPAQVVVTSGNVRPVAVAGFNQIVPVNQPVFLDGSGSYDANNDTLTYSWYFSSKPKNSLSDLIDYTLVNPIFTPDTDGEYIVSLVVNDGSIDSHSSSAAIFAIKVENVDCFIQKLIDLLNAINNLDDSDFSNENNRNALTNKIISLLENYYKGSYGSNLVGVLRNDIGDKMDGCALDQQSPEETDWITNCLAQDEVYPYVEQAIYILENDPLCEQ
jgi:hypothetical protein